MIDLRTLETDFDEEGYLASNPDVAAAVRDGSVLSGWHHVVSSGHDEDRPGLPPDIKAQVIDYWRRLEAGEGFPVPSADLRSRVHGSPDFRGFYLVGDRVASDIDAVLAEHQIAFPDAARVLDFGCGCGRVLRHVKQRHPGWDITGMDIDAEAIAWCQQYLDDVGDFTNNRPWPPLPVAANTFDIVYAVSVFTHLPEEMQDAWLNELKRITKVGGFLLLSVHPFNLAGDADGFSKDETGFLYSVGPDTAGLPSFYQVSFQSRAYVLERWAKYFEVVDVMGRRINNHQDLVVCCKISETRLILTALASHVPYGRALLHFFRPRR